MESQVETFFDCLFCDIIVCDSFVFKIFLLITKVPRMVLLKFVINITLYLLLPLVPFDSQVCLG
jgi:hypothetical protein